MHVASILAQSYVNNPQPIAVPTGALIAAMAIPLTIGLILAVLIIAGMWKVFSKAGKPGWAAIIPIYNIIVLLEVAGRPIWWIVLYLIPFVNLVPAIIVPLDVAKRFGKGAGFGIGLIFLPMIFYPILGFGSAVYQGSASPMTPRGFAPVMPQA